MINGKKFLAIIPARSGSKGLKDKNIKDLLGKPVIAYTIEAAIRSKCFDDIVVSTDSERYAEIAKKYGASVPFLRPKELADDQSSSADVIVHTLENMKSLGFTYDYFMLLQPTSPLRDELDIRKAVELLFEKNANAIVSVCEAEHSPLLMNTLDESLNMDNFITPDADKRRQDLKKYYRLNGAIYLCKTEYYLEYNNFYHSKCYAYIMEQTKSVDIDTAIDFELVKVILKNKDRDT